MHFFWLYQICKKIEKAKTCKHIACILSSFSANSIESVTGHGNFFANLSKEFSNEYDNAYKK